MHTSTTFFLFSELPAVVQGTTYTYLYRYTTNHNGRKYKDILRTNMQTKRSLYFRPVGEISWIAVAAAGSIAAAVAEVLQPAEQEVTKL